MNTANNARRQHSKEKLIEALITEIQTKELSAIRVKDLCQMAKVNRSTFYACFSDIYDLAETTRRKLEREIDAVYFREEGNIGQTELFVRLLKYIMENQDLYKAYFKLGHSYSFNLSENSQERAERFYGNKDIDYHITFFRAGLNAVIEKWLAGGCRKTPEEIAEIIASEYYPKDGWQGTNAEYHGKRAERNK